ncbi:hypothetical protein BHE18_08455 [Rossellomorea aquimaris]|uniref:Peptidase S8/S53 domain-containing protein n=1 Tax=Rossellomorea aquimaris TaxID=189382 RepID=A0A1J6WTD8_9BACI|nr:hypothetical protein BHE18_08455 [Rossellomorea aquimaris]
MNVEELHRYSKGSSQKIGLIDSGISKFQTNSKNIQYIASFDNGIDDIGHGSIMFSLIKGQRNEILGIAPESELISIKLIESDGEIAPSMMAEAIQKAIDLKCTIINLSLGSYESNKLVSQTIDKALDLGITVVASSGDYGTDEMMFPARHEGVISVGALDKNGDVTSFTNAPIRTTINFPGEEIMGVGLDGEKIMTSGTSQATALLTGYIALIKDFQKHNKNELNNDELRKLLSEIEEKDYLSAFSELN